MGGLGIDAVREVGCDGCRRFTGGRQARGAGNADQEHVRVEHKNRSVKLDGSVLFSTLEPCAPGFPTADVLAQLNKSERAGWEFLAARTGTTMTEYAQHLEVDKRTAQRHLKRFVELGLLRRVGTGPATEYVRS